MRRDEVATYELGDEFVCLFGDARQCLPLCLREFAQDEVDVVYLVAKRAVYANPGPGIALAQVGVQRFYAIIAGVAAGQPSADSAERQRQVVVNDQQVTSRG